jgi:ADP-ribose diphosphatase
MVEETISSRRAYEGSLISLRVDEVRLPSGRTTSREVVEHPGAVAVLAWDGARVAMVRQWRQAAGDELLEIPAGTREPGEEPAVTAIRELAEECGLAADGWEAGPAFFTAPGFCTERLSLFLATGLRPQEATSADDEEIDRSWLSLADALSAIDDGRIIDAKSIAGIEWLARRIAAVRG